LTSRPRRPRLLNENTSMHGRLSLMCHCVALAN
jgi:hypothetical protein